MHCLLAVSFACVCLRLAFICWKGQHFIVFGPFQQINASRKQTQVKLTTSKQCIRRFTPAGEKLHFVVRTTTSLWQYLETKRPTKPLQKGFLWKQLQFTFK